MAYVLTLAPPIAAMNCLIIAREAASQRGRGGSLATAFIANRPVGGR
jgi:hypothetical protein